MVTLIISAVLALIGTIISLLTSASVNSMLLMMDTSLLRMSSTGNLLEILNSAFDFSSEALKNTLAAKTLLNFNVAQFIMNFAYVIVIVVMSMELVSSYIATLQGEEAESPAKIVLRAVVTICVEFLIFGNPFKNPTPGLLLSNGLLYNFGNAFPAFFSALGDIDRGAAALSAWNFAVDLSVPNQIIVLILSITLFKGVVEGGLIFIERWLSFAMNILLGPIAVAMNASKKTSKTFSQWLVSLLGQIIAIFISMLMMRLMFISMAKIGASVDFNSSLLFNYAVTIGLLSLFKNSERFLSSWGLNTIAGGHTARDFRMGTMAFKGLARETIGPVNKKFRDNALERSTHKVSQTASKVFGESSGIARFTRSMDMSKSPKPTISTPVTRGVDESSGVFITEGLRGKELNSTESVNTALQKGVNQAVNMKDVIRSTGMNQIENMRVSAVGKTAYTSDGRKAVIFKGEKVNTDGTTSEPRMYAMVLGGNKLDRFNKLTGSTEGANITMSHKQGDIIELGNGTGFIQEVSMDSPKKLSESEFASSALAEKYSSYSDYTNDLSYARDYASMYNDQFERFGYDDTWKVDSLQQGSMFGTDDEELNNSIRNIDRENSLNNLQGSTPFQTLSEASGYFSADPITPDRQAMPEARTKSEKRPEINSVSSTDSLLNYDELFSKPLSDPDNKRGK